MRGQTISTLHWLVRTPGALFPKVHVSHHANVNSDPASTSGVQDLGDLTTACGDTPGCVVQGKAHVPMQNGVRNKMALDGVSPTNSNGKKQRAVWMTDSTHGVITSIHHGVSCVPVIETAPCPSPSMHNPWMKALMA